MKTKNSIYLLVSCCLFVLFYSCENKQDYEPGPEVRDNCMLVYFRSDNARNYQLTTDDEYEFILTLEREKTDKAAQVPITVVQKDPIFNIPEIAEFAAGEKTSEIKITFSEAKSATSYSLELAITDVEYVDPYTQLEGSARFFANLLIASYEVYVPNALFRFSEIYSSFYADIWKLEGTNTYKIVNYLNSGHDLNFTIDPEINTIEFAGGQSLYEGLNWYFYDEDAEAISCYPNPSSGFHITSCYFYMGGYTYFNSEIKQGRFYHYNYYSDGTEGYNALNISWE